MRVSWLPAAADDLEQIADYLLEQNPRVATEIVRRIYTAITPLKKFPNLGRPGRKDGTRELVVSSLPYIIIYEVVGQRIRIARILHAAQRSLISSLGNTGCFRTFKTEGVPVS